MTTMQAADLIANIVISLRLNDDDWLSPDAAVLMMEDMASRLHELDKATLRELIDAFDVIASASTDGVAAPEPDDDLKRVIGGIAYDFYLEEVLAADDPVRSAELGALREAETRMAGARMSLLDPNAIAGKLSERNAGREADPEDGEATLVMQLARIIADYFVFLETTDEDLLNLDTSVQMMEALAAHLENLDKAFLRKLIDSLEAVTPEYSGEARVLVGNIVHDLDLEEALAADDPVRLAELDALRDARDEQASR